MISMYSIAHKLHSRAGCGVCVKRVKLNTLLLSCECSADGCSRVSLLQLYGYCYQDSNDIKDTVTAITELGSPLEMITLLQTPWDERFRVSLASYHTQHLLSVWSSRDAQPSFRLISCEPI